MAAAPSWGAACNVHETAAGTLIVRLTEDLCWPAAPWALDRSYDLVANIAAEEFGHIELVSTAINTMLTGAGGKGALPDPGDLLNPQHFVAGGAATLVQDSNGKAWNGDYVTSTGDLVEDLTHNFFLETGARNNKLKVYESNSGIFRKPLMVL